MVDSPLIRPAISWGKRGLGGVGTLRFPWHFLLKPRIFHCHVSLTGPWPLRGNCEFNRILWILVWGYVSEQTCGPQIKILYKQIKQKCHVNTTFMFRTSRYMWLVISTCILFPGFLGQNLWRNKKSPIFPHEFSFGGWILISHFRSQSLFGA